MIDSKHLTPTPAIIFTAAIGLFMIAFSSIYQLLDFFNFLIWVFYGLDIIALFILRKRDNIENKNENGFKLKVIMQKHFIRKKFKNHYPIAANFISNYNAYFLLIINGPFNIKP